MLPLASDPTLLWEGVASGGLRRMTLETFEEDECPDSGPCRPSGGTRGSYSVTFQQDPGQRREGSTRGFGDN